jgi:hypothetical protein
VLSEGQPFPLHSPYVLPLRTGKPDGRKFFRGNPPKKLFYSSG